MLLQDFVILIALIVLCIKYENVHAIKGERKVRNARREEFPFIAAIINIYRDDEGLKTELECTGTVLTRSYILTAEHCLEGKELYALRIITHTTDLLIGNWYNVTWWMSYNQWASYREIDPNPNETDNDIAMLEVNVPTLRPVQELLSPLQPARFSGKTMRLLGWALINENRNCGPLRTGKVKPIDMDECREKSMEGEGEISQYEERFFCTAADPPILLDFGDSGGPVLYENKIIGINIGLCPRMPRRGESRVNFHITTKYYRAFIDNICAMEID